MSNEVAAEDLLTQEHIRLVQSTFAMIEPIADDAAVLFNDRLLELDPSLSSLFGDDMAVQRKALVSTLKVAVKGLNDLDSIVPALQKLGQRHAGNEVKDEVYTKVAQALLWTLEQSLGSEFTEDVKAAWTEAYMLFAGVMIDAAQSPSEKIEPQNQEDAMPETVSSDDTSQFKQMVDELPINVIICDLEEFQITYANKSSVTTLKNLEHVLPVKADDIVSQCIDIFHKNPAQLRSLLGDPANLPHQANIDVGGEKIDLLVTAVNDANGNYVAAMLTWSVVTEKLKNQTESDRLAQIVEELPTNIMICDKDDLVVTYLNKASSETLATLEHGLPCKAADILGQCIDIFYKNSEHQHKFLADPSNLPHRTIIDLADEKLDLLVTAFNDQGGNYIGPMLSWSIITQQVQLTDTFEFNVKSIVESVAGSSTELHATAETMAVAAQEASSQSMAVASATEELSKSIEEISSQVSRSTQISSEAVTEAHKSNEQVQSLSEASQKIGDVVKLINDIASQTNLLALNATIEAARAGDAGKGRCRF